MDGTKRRSQVGILAAVGCVFLIASLCHAEGQGKTFELEFRPIPGKGRSGGFGWYGSRLRPVGEAKVTTLPKGVSPDGAYCADLRLTRTSRDLTKVIVAKSEKGGEFDRFYIDANGDGAYAKDECYDISKSNGPVTRGNRDALIRPVKVFVKSGEKRSDRWIMLRLYLRPDRVQHIMYTSVSAAMGKVTFGDKQVLVALYLRQPFGGSRSGVHRVTFPSEAEKPNASRQRYINYGTSLMIDQNGDGEFKIISPYGPGGEATSLTKLVRFDDAYYKVDVADDATAITIAPAEPELGTLAIPEGPAQLTILGEATARAVEAKKDRLVELPVGTYVVFNYRYRTRAGELHCRDYRGDAIFAIEAGKTTEIEVGPPLKAKVAARVARARRGSPGRESGRSVQLGLELTDRVGRSVGGIYTAKRQRPPAPKFRILDAEDKVVHTGTFEYG